MNNANTLIDALVERMNLKNDAALCKVLKISPPVVSKMRHSTLPVGSTFILKAHKASGIPVSELEALCGGVSSIEVA